MKRLQLPGLSHWALMPKEGLDDKSVIQEDELVRHNMNELTRCALSIDNLMASFVSRYFAPADPSRQRLFDDWVAHSSSLSFNSRANIVFAIIDGDMLLKDRFDTKSLETSMKRIMYFRNAFAHGKLVANDKNGNHVIYHFSRTPQADTLDARRFEKLEKYCVEVHDGLMNLISAITRTSSDRR